MLFRSALQGMGIGVVPGVANFLLCHLPADGPDAAELVAKARQHNVFLRDVGTMGTTLGVRAVRIAVKDAASNEKVIWAIASAMRKTSQRSATKHAAARGLVHRF